MYPIKQLKINRFEQIFTCVRPWVLVKDTCICIGCETTLQYQNRSFLLKYSKTKEMGMDSSKADAWTVGFSNIQLRVIIPGEAYFIP